MGHCKDWHDHKFREDYYGWQCENCDLFYAYGTAPWEPYCNRCHAMYEEECACDDNEDFFDEEDF